MHIFFQRTSALAILSIVAAAVSAVKSLSRRNLLNRQSGIDSLRDLSCREFEHLVGEAYRRQGYDIEETGGGRAAATGTRIFRRP